MIAAITMCCTTISYAALLNISPESVEAEAWTVIDSRTEQVIAEHNPDVQRAPASLTKMMVAYIALKEIQAGRLDKHQILTATSVVKNVMWDESQMHLKEGEKISIDQLLAGLIVMSANDAALTLAEKIAGDVPSFIRRMNQEAKTLGMQHTNFQNPAGITMPEHYSTAADMAKLALALVNQTPDYLTYSQQKCFVYNQRFHRATNLLLELDPSVDGLKTGFTNAAGYNLAATANRLTKDPQLAQRRLVVIILGAKNAQKRAEIAQKLMNISYNYSRNEIVLQPNHLLAELPVHASTQKSYQLRTKQPTIITTSLYASDVPIDIEQFDQASQRLVLKLANGIQQILEPNTAFKTHVNIVLAQPVLTAPLAQNLLLATLHIYQNDQLLKSQNIEEQVEIIKASWFEKLILWFQQIFPFFSSEEIKVKDYLSAKTKTKHSC